MGVSVFHRPEDNPDRKPLSKVEIRHTSVAISNYTRGDNPYMEKFLQVYDKGRFCQKDVAIYFDDKKNMVYLPSGIQRWFLEKHFGHHNITTKVYPDNYMKSKQIQMKTKPRDDVQIEAIDFCIGADRHPGNRTKNQIFLNLNTGKGKTYVMIAVSAYFSVKTAILMYAQSWINQWKECILEYTDTTEKEIYIIMGSWSIKKILTGQVDPRKYKYFLMTLSTLQEYGKENGWEEVHKLFKMLYIGLKIYDEAHMRPENIFLIDFYTDVFKTFYVTATPMLSDPYKNIVFQRAYSTVPKINLFNEKTDPHTDYQVIYFNSRPNAVDLSRCQTKYGFNIIWYANYLPTKPIYYHLLWVIMDDLIHKLSPTGKILIYIGTNQSIMMTYHWLKYMYPLHTIGIFTTIYSKEEKKEQLKKQIILSTTKSAGLAVDIKGLEFTLDIDDPAKSPVVVRQKLGRTRDWDTLFIDVIDVGFPALRRFAQERLKVFKKYARNMFPPINLTDVIIRDRLMRIRERDAAHLKQLQERENLKPVMQARKQVIVFKDDTYNTIQY